MKQKKKNMMNVQQVDLLCHVISRLCLSLGPRLGLGLGLGFGLGLALGFGLGLALVSGTDTSRDTASYASGVHIIHVLRMRFLCCS